MANKIDILIKAKDEASKEIEGVKDSLEDLEGGAEELEKTGSKSFGDFMDNVAIAMLGINQAIEVGMKIAEAAKRVYEATVGKALDIAKEVETLSRISGDAPENISALRIAAQEAGVGFDDLYKALENLNKNGVAPTVENLVAIANEYINLEDPIAKATLLTEYFGAAGDEIAPMLEAIADGVKEVQNAGLIFTEEDIQAAKDYEQAAVDLENAWENFAVTIGKSALPALTDQLNFVAGTGTRFELIWKYLSLLNQNVKDGDGYLHGYTITLGDFLSMTESGEGVEWLTGQIAILEGTTGDLIQTLIAGSSSYEDFTAKMELYGLGTGGVTEEIYGFMRATYDMTESTESLTEAEIEAAAAAALAAAEQEKLNTTLTSTVFTLGQKYTPILDDIADKQADIAELNQIIKNGGGVFDGVAISAADAQIKVNGLTDEINASIDAMKAMAAQAVAGIAWDQITADGKLTMDEITRYYDYLVNTGLMSAEAGQLATQNLINAWSEWDPEMKQLLLESLLDTTEVDDYVPESKEFPVGARVDPSEFDGWTPEQKEFWLLIRPETSEIDDYEPPTLTGTVNYVIGNMPHIPVAAGGSVHAAASGVAASLPHYWVGELGPEPFFPSVDGRIVSNTQALAALRGGAGADSKEIADAVKKGVKEAMRDGSVGSVYNLTMPTSSNPADIRMAFELMEAWGT